MMKKMYNTPEVDFIVLEADKDILILSSDVTVNDDDPDTSGNHGNISVRF